MDQLVDFLLNFSGVTPYLLVFGVLLICGFGLPIPEDIILVTAGLVSYYGLTHVGTMSVVAYLGVILGDSIIYYLGFVYGPRLTQKWLFSKLFPPERLLKVSEKLKKQGNQLIFFARFMPGLRAPIFFTVGTLRLPYRLFLLYDGGAALMSVPLIVGAVYYFGDQLDRVVRIIKDVEHGIVVTLLGVVILLGVKFYFQKMRIIRKT